MTFVKVATVFLSGVVIAFILVFWLLGAFSATIDKKVIMYWANGLGVLLIWVFICIMAFYPKPIFTVLPFLSKKTIQTTIDIILNVLFYFLVFMIARQIIQVNFKNIKKI